MPWNKKATIDENLNLLRRHYTIEIYVQRKPWLHVHGMRESLIEKP